MKIGYNGKLKRKSTINFSHFVIFVDAFYLLYIFYKKKGELEDVWTLYYEIIEFKRFLFFRNLKISLFEGQKEKYLTFPRLLSYLFYLKKIKKQNKKNS